MVREKLNKISEKVIGISFEIHRILGPGFNEKVYSEALQEELNRSNIKSEPEKSINVNYKGQIIGEQRIDFLIEDSIILELKSIDKIGKIHLAQMISYLKTLDKRLGLILNFANKSLEIKRVVNNL